MPCYHPLTGYFGKDADPVTGRRPIVFNKLQSHSGVPLRLPCGQCIGCRLERSRQWAMRCMHEKRMHGASAFLTLTYSDGNIPELGSLSKRDLQLFMKRLRKKMGAGIRFFACGEYGETTLRPHYHVLLLNACFTDMKKYSARSENSMYVSAELDGLWTNGCSLIGEVTFDSCAYVARYCLKKVTGKGAADHYMGREPEFTVMSRRPGIGYSYYEKYRDEAYKHDSVIVNGFEVGLPRYYDTKYEITNAEHLEKLKVLRRRRALDKRLDNTPERRRARETFEQQKQQFFGRNKL